MQLLHMALNRHLGLFAVGAEARTCLIKLSWDIPVIVPSQSSWDVCIQRSVSKFGILPMPQLHNLSRSFMLWRLHRYLTFGACTWDCIVSVMKKVMDICQRPIWKLTAFLCLKDPKCESSGIKLTQNCICFLPCVTRDYHPEYLTSRPAAVF